MTHFNLKTPEGRKAYSRDYRSKHKKEIKDYRHAYNIAHKEKMKAYRHAYYITHKKKMVRASKLWVKNNPKKVKKRADTYYANNVEKIRIRTRKQNRAVKIEILTHYGPKGKLKCSWLGCGVTDVDMLSLDHIENNGAAERRKSSGAGGSTFYMFLRKGGYPKGYQTLCHNHQWKKEIARRNKI